MHQTKALKKPISIISGQVALRLMLKGVMLKVSWQTNRATHISDTERDTEEQSKDTGVCTWYSSLPQSYGVTEVEGEKEKGERRKRERRGRGRSTNW